MLSNLSQAILLQNEWMSQDVNLHNYQAPEDLFQGCYPQSKWIR